MTPDLKTSRRDPFKISDSLVAQQSVMYPVQPYDPALSLSPILARDSDEATSEPPT